MPNIGDRVHVRPRHGLQVQRGEGLFQQYLAPDGQEVLWDDHLCRRHGEGAIEIVPAATPAPEAPSPAPSEGVS